MALGKHLSMFPKSRAPVETEVHFQNLTSIFFGVTSKGAHLQVPLTELPQRGMPHS